VRVPSSNDVTVAVHDLGGAGEPLLIAHATGFCGRAYEPLAAELGERFHVWALDFRSHGESTAVDDLHWHRVTDDLDAAVAALGGPPVRAFGHSMGGACALLAEARRPGTFTSLFVYEPVVLSTDPAGGGPSGMIESTLRRRPTFPSRAEALQRYASRGPLDVLRADALHAYVQHGFEDLPDGSVGLRCAPRHEAAIFEGSGQITYDDVRAVDIPVVVSAGLRDADSAPAASTDGLVAALRHARLERHRHLGHFGPLQDPGTVAASVLAAASA
jgi:pimeloyl-ACP methyl ester carboxylesterase